MDLEGRVYVLDRGERSLRLYVYEEGFLMDTVEVEIRDVSTRRSISIVLEKKDVEKLIAALLEFIEESRRRIDADSVDLGGVV